MTVGYMVAHLPSAVARQFIAGLVLRKLVLIWTSCQLMWKGSFSLNPFQVCVKCSKTFCGQSQVFEWKLLKFRKLGSVYFWSNKFDHLILPLAASQVLSSGKKIDTALIALRDWEQLANRTCAKRLHFFYKLYRKCICLVQVPCYSTYKIAISASVIETCEACSRIFDTCLLLLCLIIDDQWAG